MNSGPVISRVVVKMSSTSTMSSVLHREVLPRASSNHHSHSTMTTTTTTTTSMRIQEIVPAKNNTIRKISTHRINMRVTTSKIKYRTNMRVTTNKIKHRINMQVTTSKTTMAQLNTEQILSPTKTTRMMTTTISSTTSENGVNQLTNTASISPTLKTSMLAKIILRQPIRQKTITVTITTTTTVVVRTTLQTTLPMTITTTAAPTTSKIIMVASKTITIMHSRSSQSIRHLVSRSHQISRKPIFQTFLRTNLRTHALLNCRHRQMSIHSHSRILILSFLRKNFKRKYQGGAA